LRGIIGVVLNDQSGGIEIDRKIRLALRKAVEETERRLMPRIEQRGAWSKSAFQYPGKAQRRNGK
jgi:hypothetical protein